ncbi:MAG: DUF1343 domain-containing protein [Flavobacteriales bacterium]|nr:DUF1343 domain-containing protein [Flavobacteriales bacterium]
MTKTFTHLLTVLWLSACGQPAPTALPTNTSMSEPATSRSKPLRLGAERTEVYLPLLEGKSVGIVANQTTLVGQIHLVDTLLALGLNVKCAFAPEHGFRGNASAGEKITDSKDPKTGLSIVSLYGSNYKPSVKQLEGLDVVIFDIQDVGARFYTYISTMSYMMEACAENNIPVIILDRPNPNGHYVDGPVLKKEFSSFVGLHEIPVVHGMTVGEYAQMVNAEGWLKDGVKCKLTVIELENYSRKTPYELPIAPSPNLPNQKAIYLYPSLCYFEGTVVSEGRGTDKPFQQFGYPKMPNGNTKFTPKDIKGVASNPKFKDKGCLGIDLSSLPEDSLRKLAQLNLNWLIETYRNYPEKDKFFDKKFFDLLAGSSQLREQIIAEKSVEEIRASWEADLLQFKMKRKKYLLYP